uniref:Uncharacterized protein n=1 Tax=Ammonifex degensii TaxID=42838 RepID=A0A7C1F389_9THEO
MTEAEFHNLFYNTNEEDHRRLFSRLREILDSGYLLPGKTFKGSRTLIWDKYAGDDKYVFLSLGKRYIEQYGEYAYGFVFDARQLIIELNAVLGIEDLAWDYHKLAMEAFEQVFLTISRGSIVPFKTSGWMHAGVKEMPLEKQYLYHAIYAGRTELPGVKEFQQVFRQLTKHVQATKRFSGTQALNVMEQWENLAKKPTRDPEILVPDKLPIPYALSLIQRGKEIPLSQKRVE